MRPNHTYIWQPGYTSLPDLQTLVDIEEQAARTAWNAECAKVQAPARIAYKDLAFLADLASFVRLFEDCLSFDDTGLTMQRRG